MSPRSLFAIHAAISALLLAAPAGAVEFKHGEGPFVPVHNCTCRLGGEEVALGQRRCIRTDQGCYSAVCVTEQNVTSWRRGQDGCPEASLGAPRG